MDKNPSLAGDRFRTCRWCGHDANPSTAIACEVCERPLDASPANPKATTKLASGLSVPLLSLSALAVVVAGVGGYWVWRQQTPIERAIPEISRASRIQIYRTIKDVPNVPKGIFNYHNTLPFAALAKEMNAAINQAYPGFQLRYTEPLQGNPGSAAAIRMLIDGTVSLASSARPIEDAEINRAKARNVIIEQIPVAIDGIVFVTHPDVSVSGLSIQQAQDIYSGKVTNWKELGGSSLPIVPFSLEPKEAAAPKQALGEVADKLGQNVQIVRDHTEAIRRVASTPGAIYFGAVVNLTGQETIRILSLAKGSSNAYVSPVTETGAVDQQAFRDGTYPLTRRLFVVIRRDGTPEEQAGVAYANFFLSEEGQQIIGKAGFVPLY